MENFDIFGDLIFSHLNGCVNTSLYPLLLKMANITLVYKKDSKGAKSNYGPVSILSNTCKVYERIMFKRTSKYCLTVFSININMDLEKELELSIV